MKFFKHSDLEGKHAFLGASKYHWVNYDDNKLVEAYARSIANQQGTEIHEFAAKCIRLKQRLPKSKKTLNMYVNDAIGFRMVPEQVLYFSDNCFGTADAISFNNNFLRIHDLKTGYIPAHMEQLMIYAALFCLEYRIKPTSIQSELRIYQLDDIIYHTPEADEIEAYCDKIVNADRIISKLRLEEG